MSQSVLILLLSITFPLCAVAQNIKKVSASYTYYAPETISVEEAKRTALERAKIQAIADEFGTLISQSTSTIVSNNNGQTDSKFFSLGGSDIKGEWIETTKGPDYTITYSDGMLTVNASISGKIKQLPDIRIPLMASLLRNGFELHDESDTFHSGDDIYLNFQSPVSGFLLVYLIDHYSDEAFCLLPYSASDSPSAPIRPDTEYTFFSSEHPGLFDKSIIDEYTLTCSSSSGTDYNEIILLFSPEPMVKGNTRQSSGTLPRQMSLKEFNRWYSTLLSTPQNIQTIKKPITIIN